jgi:hypothetical protein
MDCWHGSNGSAPALQALIPEFKPQYHLKEKKKIQPENSYLPKNQLYHKTRV